MGSVLPAPPKELMPQFSSQEQTENRRESAQKQPGEPQHQLALRSGNSPPVSSSIALESGRGCKAYGTDRSTRATTPTMDKDTRPITHVPQARHVNETHVMDRASSRLEFKSGLSPTTGPSVCPHHVQRECPLQEGSMRLLQGRKIRHRCNLARGMTAG